MSAPRRYFSAETVSQAVIEAAGHFDLLPAELAYRLLEKKAGALRRSRVVIEVDPAQPRKAVEATPMERLAEHSTTAMPRPVPSPTRALPPAGTAPGLERRREHEEVGPWAAPLPFAVATGTAGALVAVDAVVELACLRVGATAEGVATDDGNAIHVDLTGADRDVLLAHQGELLGACEYLVRRMVRDLPEGGLVADAAGYRAEREGELRRRAAAAAAEARASGTPVLFEPLPAAERRIVHLAIQDEAGVASESSGEGEMRRVRVFPAGPVGDESRG